MLDGISFRRRQRGLWRHRVTGRVSLDLQTGLDARREIESCEGLIDAPVIALQFHRFRPFPRLAQVIEAHTLARHDTGRPRDPSRRLRSASRPPEYAPKLKRLSCAARDS